MVKSFLAASTANRWSMEHRLQVYRKMRSPEEDLRVRRTEKLLRQAVIQLIVQKGYDNLTIQDIVNQAEVARVTFYRHYKDKEELLTACLDEVYSSLQSRLNRLSLQDFSSDHPPIITFYDHVAENRDLYRAIFKSQGSFAAQSRIRDYLIHLIQREIRTLLPGRSFQIPVHLIALHAASAELGMVMWWIENPQTYPALYMARVSHWINLVGVLHSLGVQDTQQIVATPPTL
jgi:AcrR family transcriptional regulator